MNSHVRRRAARAFVCSPEGEILLIEHKDPTSGEVFWVTPGGGLEAGEDFVACLRRELFEETGLVIDDIGPPVWRRVNTFSWRGELFEQEEVFYSIVHPKFVPLAANATAAEQLAFTRFRWWSVGAISTSGETFSPANIAAVVDRVLSEKVKRIPAMEPSPELRLPVPRSVRGIES